MKKKISGGSIQDVIDFMTFIFKLGFNIIFFFLRPIFLLINDFIIWYFKPDGAMPMTFTHISFFGFFIAILLFMGENILVLFIRFITDILFKYIFLSNYSFNLDFWIKLYQLNFVLLFYTLFYKFFVGKLNLFYLYTIIGVVAVLFQKGLNYQILYGITGIWWAPY